MYIDKNTQLNSLDKKAIKSWRLSRIILLIIFSIIFVAFRVLIKNLHSTFVMITTLIEIAILILLSINAFIYPKIEYNRWKYRITEDKIEFFRGIFFINHTIIPMLRIQHITVSQGPINKRYNIANIDISTAGGVRVLQGLPKEDADEICEYINNNVIEKLKDKALEKENKINFKEEVLTDNNNDQEGDING